jgi:transposase
MGRIGQFTFQDAVSRRVSQLPDYPDVGFKRHNTGHSQTPRMRDGHGDKSQAVISKRRCQRFVSYKAAWTSLSSYADISSSDEAGRADQPDETRVWFFDMVSGSTGRAFGQDYGCSIQRRPDTQIIAPAGIFISSPQAHTQRQEERGGLRKGQETAYSPEKKVMKPDSREALVFQDETEIHRHPALTRMWGPKGKQPEVLSPGENEKKVVYGGVDYATGKITYTIAATKSGYNFLAFLIVLVKSYAGRKMRLVCDNGRFHHTRAVQEWLRANKSLVEIFWLPPYCPSLNLIERLWGHLKRTVLANVLFETMNELVVAFCRGVSRVNGRRNKMGFIFDHDDVNRKVA